MAPNASETPPRVELVGFDPRFLPEYVRLNRAWIEEHFAIECMDLAQLENPRELILDPGGEIFFLLEDGKVRGTCAMVPHGPGAYELAKMAVDEPARGRGYGSRLIEHVVEWARARGARKVTLLSNTKLTPAITLYRKHGFETVHLGTHPDYARCNIEMERTLGF